jgi:nicotinate-nucleotide adenylyltransferase
MQAFQESYPLYEFYFVLGSDLLPSFKRWDRGETMLEDYKFIIIPREGYEELDEDLYPRHYTKSETKVEDAFSTSSTEIREILQWSNIVAHAVYLKKKLGKQVYDFIIENNLFA